MSTDIATSVTAQLSAAATAVAQSWGLGDALVVGEPTSNLPVPQGFSGQAVVVEVTGRTPGKVAIVVDDDIAQQLLESPAAPPDLIAALEPATTAACLAIGDVHAGAANVLEASLAIAQVLSLADAGGATLTDEGTVRAIVLAGAQAPDAAGPAGIPTDDSEPDDGGIPAQGSHGMQSSRAAHADPPAGRLDLLRGVVMEATVELGRTSMTINDLLALRSGSVIELDRGAGAPVDLYINGRLIAHGEVVVVDENYGLRVQQVVSDETNG